MMRGTILISFLLVGVAVALPWDQWDMSYGRAAAPTCQCGWVNRGRIVGGKETRRNEYPMMAALYSMDGSFACGASIISEWHILTASHCVAVETGTKIPMKPGDLKVAVGTHHLQQRSEDYHDVDRIVMHERYDPFKLYNDIAIISLKTPIRFTQTVGPACLISKRPNIDRQTVTAVGWGATAYQGQISQVLKDLNLRVVPMKECIERWRHVDPMYAGISPQPEQNMCTYEYRQATCQGDSGGPLLWLDPSTNKYTQVGLVSYAAKCGDETPTVFADVPAYYNWIVRAMQATKPGVLPCTQY